MYESCLTDCVLIEMISQLRPYLHFDRLRCLEGFRRARHRCVSVACCALAHFAQSQLTLSLLKYSEVVKTLTKNANISKLITVECLDAVHHAVAEGKITSAAKGGMQYSIITRVGFIPPFSKDNPETDGPCYTARGLASGE